MGETERGVTARLPPGKVSIRRAFAVGFEFRQTVRPFLSMFLIFFQAMFLQKSVAGQFVSVSEYVHVYSLNVVCYL